MSVPGQEPAGQPEAPSAPEGQPPEPPSQPDGFDRLYQRMDQMTAQQAQLAESLQQIMTPEEEEPEESDFYTDQGELTEDGARAVISDLVREQIQSEMAPRERARQIEQRDDAFEALRDQYPELQDEKVSEAVLADAIRWAQGHNPAIVESPAFVDVIEWVYQARQLQTLREAQAAEQPRPVVLESAQGARQQQQPNDPDWGDRIVKAAERLRPQI
jgi:polyhydroxyalkanoate synthesis regulator phasin